MAVTPERLHVLFKYNDGQLIRKTTVSSNAKAGDRAGTISKRGNRDVSVDGKTMKEHRVIFLMLKGYLPVEVDHVDGNPLNNSIDNLRSCSSSENKYNTSKRSDNTSGLKGVSWNTNTNSWRAKLFAEGKQIEIGSFKTIFEAACNIIPARQQSHGAFARQR